MSRLRAPSSRHPAGIDLSAAVKTFGVHGAAELIYLVGLYCLVSVTLNGFNVPVPESEAE